MTQSQLLIDLFRQHGNRLTTKDFGDHPVLWAEYRRSLCDLKRAGYFYTAKPLSRNLWEYRLIEPEPSGQMKFA